MHITAQTKSQARRAPSVEEDKTRNSPVGVIQIHTLSSRYRSRIGRGTVRLIRANKHERPTQRIAQPDLLCERADVESGDGRGRIHDCLVLESVWLCE